MFHNTLYLDAARLGKMSPRACNASIDLARFASEHSCTLYFSQLLQDGFSSWPSALQQQYPGLSNWKGVLPFKDNLRQLAEANQDTEVLLTSRGATLMKLATRLLSGPCRNVLMTDTCWPAYKKILQRNLRRTCTTFSEVLVRHRVLRESISPSALVEFLAGEFVRKKCDGLFVPLVDNLGVRLPIEALVTRIRQQAELRFVVVDGAQAIGHVPLQLKANYCDFLLSGSHKWLRAFHTMGIGFFGNPSSRDYIADSLFSWSRTGSIDDPLLAFSDELVAGTEHPFGETVQVAPLLIANAATQEFLLKKSSTAAIQQTNCQTVVEIAAQVGWNHVAPAPAMTSQILLFENQLFRRERVAGDDLRQTLLSHGVAATVYSNGLLRLSLPDEPLDSTSQMRLSVALAAAAPATHSRYFF